MKEMNSETLLKSSFCDMSLLGFHWEEDVLNLVLSVELGNGQRAQLRCIWATNVRIDIDTGHTLGPPSTWEGSIEQDDQGIYHVYFDFPGVGEVSLKCNEVTVTWSGQEDAP